MYRLPMQWGVAAEVLAGLLLWLSASDWIADWAANWIVLAAVLSHSVSSYFFARGFWQLLPRRYKLPAQKKPEFSGCLYMDFTGPRCAWHTVEHHQRFTTPAQPFFPQCKDCCLA